MGRPRKNSDGRLGSFIIYFLRYVKLDNYYREHPTFQRFAKYGVLTTITFWVAKAPMIWLFETVFPDLNLVLFAIPSYMLSAFVAGILVTLLGFVYSEWSIWKK